MAQCEMCGKNNELVTADIEGVELKVCDACSRFGTIRKRVDTRRFTPKPEKPEGPQFKVVDNYASLVRSAREKKRMTQEEFALFLKEKESVLAHWEAGSVKPSIEAAQRVGRILGISLVEQEIAVLVKIEDGKKADELTLGDFIKVRKRK
ncbi:MAG: multiprotein bridging factor aMBF1 [Nanoarchaeota archaeon]|nr:multiprotein bridging factor aMBF1 [Nanoarchaeota archaeon]